MDKKKNRIKRATKTRKKINNLKAIRLVVHRTSRHIYAQIISKNGNKTLVSASSTEKNIKNQVKYTGNKNTAQLIGQIIAERALKKSIQISAFDRSGFKYHGRIQKLAESARKSGLKF
ncbi:MAG: 50S ribosomal protein L18 [Arsenophonus sp.]|nr:MAG: 50S ribosomal protein L18 [Arsenophonus sp.]